MVKKVRKIFVLLIGLTVLIVGILMLVLPGPAFIVIPAGLGILATEFIWAKNALQKVKEKATQSMQALKKKKSLS